MGRWSTLLADETVWGQRLGVTTSVLLYFLLFLFTFSFLFQEKNLGSFIKAQLECEENRNLEILLHIEASQLLEIS